MKKKLFGLLACVMMFALALGLVACGDLLNDIDEPETYTVTFVNGEQTVKTSSVEKGAALAETDFPEAPTPPAEKQFDGWYVGEEKLSVGFVPEADITANAKFSDIGGSSAEQYTVTFVVEGDTIKTVTVNAGSKPAANDLPSDPSKEHYTFDGWFDSEDNEFDEDAAVNASATYTAKFTKADFLITFEQEGKDDKTVWVTKQSGKLTATDIPVPEAVSDADGVFVGWYKDGVKASSDTEITEDTTFVAIFTKEADYTGSWYNEDEKLQLYFKEDGSIQFGSSTLDSPTYNEEDGTLTCEISETLSYRKWTILIAGDSMFITDFRQEGQDDYTDTYVLAKAEGNFALAGTYRKSGPDSSYLEIIDSGIVTYFNSTAYYGRIVAEGNGYKLDYYSSESSHVSLDIVKDAKGNLLITGTDVSNDQKGIFVKDSSKDDFKSFDHDTEEYLYVHTVNGEKVYVYSVNETNTFYYVTVEGNLEVGEKLTLTKEDETSVTHLIKIVADSDFDFAGEELGTFTMDGESDLKLDGFDEATLGSAEPVSYYIVGNIVVADGNGYKIDIQNGTYTKLTKQTGKYVGKFYNATQTFYNNRTATLDGFGIIIEEYNGETIYGAYEIEGNQLTVTGIESADNNLTNGTYTLADDGQVIHTADEKKIFVRDNYVLYSKLDEFTGDNEGYWTKDGGEDEYIEIIVDDKKITKLDYNGSTVPSGYYTVRFDGSSINISSYGLGLEITLTIEGVNLKVSGTVSNVTVSDTYTSSPKPATEKDAFAGGWTGSVFSGTSTFWFDGFGTGLKITGNSKDEFSYKPIGNVATFAIGDYEYELTLNGESISATWCQEYEDPVPFTLAKGTPDKFEGVWNSEDEQKSAIRFTVTGYGFVFIKDMDGYRKAGTVAYTKKGDNEITFEYDDYEYTCTLNDDNSMTVNSTLCGDYDITNCPYTRESDAEQGGGDDLDAFAGTWKFDSITVVFDGKGKVTYDGQEYSYTIDGQGKAVFENSAYTVTCTLEDDDTLDMYFDDGYGEDTFNKTATKQA